MNLTRFRKPPSTAQRLFDTAEDLTHPRPGLFPPALGEAATGVVQEESTSSTSIPMDVLDSVEVMMSAPRFVGVMEGTIPVSLRIRIKPEDDLDGLVLDTFDVEVTQLETYRYACSQYLMVS